MPFQLCRDVAEPRRSIVREASLQVRHRAAREHGRAGHQHAGCSDQASYTQVRVLQSGSLPARHCIRIPRRHRLFTTGQWSLLGDGHGRKRLPDKLLVGEGAVGFGGIEEGDTALMRRPQRPDGLLAVRHVAIGEAQSEAAIADGRDFEALSKDMRLHQRCPFRNSGLAEHGIDAVLMETRQRLRWHGRKVWHRRTRPGLALGVAGCEAPPSHHRWGRIPAPAARAGWRHGSPVTG